MRSLRSSPGRTGLASAQKWPASAQRASGRRLAAPKSPTCCRPFLNGAEPDRARRARPLPERLQWVSARARGPQHGRRGSAWSNKWRRAKQRLTSRESRSRPPKRTQAQQQLANADPPAPGGGRHGTVRSRRFVPLAGPAQRPAHEPSLFTSSEDGRAGPVAAASSQQQQQQPVCCWRRVARITFALLFVSPVARRPERQLASQFAGHDRRRRRVGSSPLRCCFPSPSWLSVGRPVGRLASLKRIVASRSSLV